MTQTSSMIMLSGDQYDQVVKETMQEFMNEYREQDMGVLLFTMAGVAFAGKMKRRLFDEEETKQ